MVPLMCDPLQKEMTDSIRRMNQSWMCHGVVDDAMDDAASRAYVLYQY
jgi:hypothetical protein